MKPPRKPRSGKKPQGTAPSKPAKARSDHGRSHRKKEQGFRPKPAFDRANQQGGDTSQSAKKEILHATIRPPQVRRLLAHDGAPVSKTGLMLQRPQSDDYTLLDSGFGRKLEQYGDLRLIRPEEQALWQPQLDEREWSRADAVFDTEAGTGEDTDRAGRWKFSGKAANMMLEDTWPLSHNGVDYLARFTAFRHVGVFSEQAAHWAWFSDLIQKQKARRPERTLRILNLFGYTGLASLMAAKAGAEVTHVDASKKAIGWARENQNAAGLENAPIRWICDDAVKFVAREGRRGNRYDGIILDPPKYGRGPKGEVWELFDDLPELVHQTVGLLSDNALFYLLSSYAIRASFMASHGLSQDAFSGRGGTLESGELLIGDPDQRQLSTSLFTRWSKI